MAPETEQQPSATAMHPAWPVELPEGFGPTAEEHLSYLLSIKEVLRERKPTGGGPAGRGSGAGP